MPSGNVNPSIPTASGTTSIPADSSSSSSGQRQEQIKLTEREQNPRTLRDLTRPREFLDSSPRSAPRLLLAALKKAQTDLEHGIQNGNDSAAAEHQSHCNDIAEVASFLGDGLSRDEKISKFQQFQEKTRTRIKELQESGRPGVETIVSQFQKLIQNADREIEKVKASYEKTLKFLGLKEPTPEAFELSSMETKIVLDDVRVQLDPIHGVAANRHTLAEQHRNAGIRDRSNFFRHLTAFEASYSMRMGSLNSPNMASMTSNLQFQRARSLANSILSMGTSAGQTEFRLETVLERLQTSFNELDGSAAIFEESARSRALNTALTRRITALSQAQVLAHQELRRRANLPARSTSAAPENVQQEAPRQETMNDSRPRDTEQLIENGSLPVPDVD